MAIHSAVTMEKAKSEATEERMQLLAAYEHGCVHLLCRADLNAEIVPNANRIHRSVKKFLIEGVYRTMVVNTRSASAAYKLPIETVLEFHSVYEV